MAGKAELLATVGEDRWLVRTQCPGCDGTRVDHLGRLATKEYRHGAEVIAMPARPVILLRCRTCGLAFKDVLPSPELLSAAFRRQAGTFWTDAYGYAAEVALIRKLVAGPIDLLDVGTSSGGLLAALGYSLPGRRSALDVVLHPSCRGRVRGEFIVGLLDDPKLEWSRQPYDVVTAFDLLEHVYDPRQAFANLRQLVRPGGFLIAETGDADSVWPQRYGLPHWWYARFVEHHVFWSPRALQLLAAAHGFRIVNVVRKRHKEQAGQPWKAVVDRGVRSALYRTSPPGYRRLARQLGRSGGQPVSPFARDHFRAVLQRQV